MKNLVVLAERNKWTFRLLVTVVTMLFTLISVFFLVILAPLEILWEGLCYTKVIYGEYWHATVGVYGQYWRSFKAGCRVE